MTPNPDPRGTERFFFDTFGFIPDGMQAMAFRQAANEFLPVNGETVFRFDITTARFGDVRGSAFVGSLLYMAESQAAGRRASCIGLNGHRPNVVGQHQPAHDSVFSNTVVEPLSQSNAIGGHILRLPGGDVASVESISWDDQWR